MHSIAEPRDIMASENTFKLTRDFSFNSHRKSVLFAISEREDIGRGLMVHDKERS
jgi:hypothetical protein